jgi:putative endonuclease
VVQEVNRRRPAPGRLGRAAEWAALIFLMTKGYRLRHRNWRAPSGELDLVMEHGRDLVIVEVKARTSDLFGGAAGAVDGRKCRRLMATADAYLGRYDLWERPCRFDVVTVERSTGFPWWRIRHLKHALSCDEGRMM